MSLGSRLHWRGDNDAQLVKRFFPLAGRLGRLNDLDELRALAHAQRAARANDGQAVRHERCN